MRADVSSAGFSEGLRQRANRSFGKLLTSYRLPRAGLEAGGSRSKVQRRLWSCELLERRLSQTLGASRCADAAIEELDATLKRLQEIPPSDTGGTCDHLVPALMDVSTALRAEMQFIASALDALSTSRAELNKAVNHLVDASVTAQTLRLNVVASVTTLGSVDDALDEHRSLLTSEASTCHPTLTHASSPSCSVSERPA